MCHEKSKFQNKLLNENLVEFKEWNFINNLQFLA